MESINSSGGFEYDTPIMTEATCLLPSKGEPLHNYINPVRVTTYSSHEVSIDASSLAGEPDCSSLGSMGQPQSSNSKWDGKIAVCHEDRELMSVDTTSNLQCLMHLLKGNIGTGILAMPVAFMHSGLWVGFAGILFIGLMATHCMHVLVRCSRILSERTSNMTLGYADVMEYCLKTGPLRFKKFANASRHIVNGLLIFTQFGFCCVYIVFIAESVQQVVTIYHSENPSLRVYEALVVLLLIPYCMIRNLRTLAPFSSFANFLTIAGLIIIFQYIVQGLHNTNELPAFNSFSQLPLFFGTAMYAFEGISLVLPLENSMRTPEDFGGWTGVLNLGMVTVTCLYTAVGFYGYLKYGSSVEGSITLNLPQSWLYVMVKIMFAVAIFVSYGVQFYVPIRIMWPKFEHKLKRRWQQKYGEYIFRALFVLITAGFALLIPHLDLLISLIGAVASSSLAMILPAIIELLTLSSEHSPMSPITVLKDIFLILFGLLGFITGTYTSLVEIINTF